MRRSWLILITALLAVAGSLTLSSRSDASPLIAAAPFAPAAASDNSTVTPVYYRYWRHRHYGGYHRHYYRRYGWYHHHRHWY
jgi:hypothetical protein